MRLVYGGYQFPPDSVAVATSREIIDDDRGLPATARDTFTMQGWILGDTQSEITAKCRELEAALSIQGRDLIMYQDNGAVAFSMRNATSLTGVRVRSGPNYPNGADAEYSTYRTFTFTAVADYPLQPKEGGSLLITFQETLAFSGGGPVNDFLQPVNADPILQTLFKSVPYRATQQGRASALLTWPIAPAPMWPRPILLRGVDVTFDGPQKTQRGIEFGIAWSYAFGSAKPLLGRPHVWIGSG